jgi:CheY-like chemotaxis protein
MHTMAHIIVVEDDADIANLYQRLLYNYETHVAETAEDAISHLAHAEPNPDLVILDFHLPDEPGFTVLDYIRSHPSIANTTVWGISADDLLEDQAKQKGLDRFFPKPLELPQLLTEVRGLLGS